MHLVVYYRLLSILQLHIFGILSSWNRKESRKVKGHKRIEVWTIGEKKSMIMVIIFACFGKLKSHKWKHLYVKRTLQIFLLFHALNIVLRTLYTSHLIFMSTYEITEFKRYYMTCSRFARNWWTRDINLGQSDFRLLLFNCYVVLPYISK